MSTKKPHLEHFKMFMGQENSVRFSRVHEGIPLCKTWFRNGNELTFKLLLLKVTSDSP